MTAVVESGHRRGQPASGGRLRPAAWLVAAPALLFLAVASALVLLRVEPFVSYYYLLAWYPTLLLLDAAQAARSGRYYLLTRPRVALSVLAWSAVLWFFFELVNFRVANWYYVFLPPRRSERWLATAVAFATVLPVIFLAERGLAVRGVFDRVRWRPFRVTGRALNGVFVVGVAFAALSLAWPRAFFPLIWGALTLLLEPWNYRRDQSRSLLADLSGGRPGRLLRLLLGGLAIGFLWELYNVEARSKWIYTVPGLESVKLFEMPVLGFGGFPVFALDCFVVYQSLVLARVAVPTGFAGGGPQRWLRPARTAVAAVAALVFSLAVLSGMDRWTVDSYEPRLEGLWLLDDAARARLAGGGYGDPFALARAAPDELARAAGVSRAEAAGWVEAARLSTLRGIGTENARLLWNAGVRSVRALAAADPGRLASRLRKMADRPRAAAAPRVRVWVRAARRATRISHPGSGAG